VQSIARALYVGDTTPGTTSEQRARALSLLGLRVSTISPYDFVVPHRNKLSIQRRLYLAGLPVSYSEPHGLNEAIVEGARRIKPDILWIDKGWYVWRETLEKIMTDDLNCLFIGFSPDDMAARHNRSHDFDRHLNLYHAFITTKSYNVCELRAAGCSRVIFLSNSFDPDTHRPMPPDHLTQQFDSPVSFVGTFEAARAASLRKLAAAGIPIRIWGSFWKQWGRPPLGAIVEGRDVIGDDYARVISASDINLCFLRKVNRDLQTTRSVEIPAAGGFMLAERTQEHRDLFEEGTEAEFFGSDEELIDKCRYYLAHPDYRKRIAEAGRLRCVKSGYDYRSRLAEALRNVGIIVGRRHNELSALSKARS
jgi:spore maturation protein CgeB